jgi:hypothetical protein
MSRIFGLASAVAAIMLAAMLLPAAASAAIPANDDFDTPTVLSGASGSVSGSTIGASQQSGEPCDWACGDSVWFAWTTPSAAPASATFSLCGSSFDTILIVYTGSTLGTLGLVAVNDDAQAACGGQQSQLSFTAQPGVQYRIRVGGYDGYGGAYTLAWNADVVAGSDTTPPVLDAPTSVTATATTSSGALVPFTATAVDAHDGAVGVTCNPGAGTLFPLGTTSVTCSAQDAAGNSVSATFPVTVTYSWSGVLAPLNADGSSIYKVNSTIPIKFRLTGFSGAITNAIAHVTLTKISSGISGDVVESTVTIAPTAGDTFRYVDGQYIYNLSTKGLSKGTYRIGIVLGDTVVHTVDVSIR